MPTSTNLVRNLRDANADMANIFNVQSTHSPFEGLVHKKRSKQGYARFFALTQRAAYRPHKGEIKPVSLSAQEYEIETILYTLGYTISRKTLENAKAIGGDSEIMEVIRDSAKDAVQARDVRLTELLEDNGSDILGSSFFGTDVDIFGTDKRGTITNSLSESNFDKADLQGLYYAFIELVMTQKNSAGRLMFGTGDPHVKPKVMFHPSRFEAFEKAFKLSTAPDSAAQNLVRDKVIFAPNGHMTDDTKSYWFWEPGRFPYALCLAEDGPPRLESDENTNSRASMVAQDNFYASDYSFEAGYGNRMVCVQNDHS